MIENKSENTFLRFGTIASFYFKDHLEANTVKLDYDSDKEKQHKMEFSNVVDELNKQKGQTKGQENFRINTKNTYRTKTKSSAKEQDNRPDFLKYAFLQTKGLFKAEVEVHRFTKNKDIETNYESTLFCILPAGEHSARRKLKETLKQLKRTNKDYLREIRNKEHSSVIELLDKVRAEIQSSHDLFEEALKTKELINFDDSLYLIHVNTGKFLKFQLDKEDMRTYLVLTDRPCRHTTFRIKPGYDYQLENSSNLYTKLSVSIATGEKSTSREFCIVNSEPEELNLKRQPSFTSHQGLSSTRTIIQSTVKQLEPPSKRTICSENERNKWYLSSFCENLLEANANLNMLDAFWIINSERESYLTAREETKTVKPYAFDVKPSEQLEQDEEMLRRDAGSIVMTNVINKPPDKEESYPIRKVAVKEGPNRMGDFKVVDHNSGEIESESRFFLSFDEKDPSLKKNPLGLLVFEPVTKDIENDARYKINLPPRIDGIKYKCFFKIKNVATNSYLQSSNSTSLQLLSPNEMNKIEDSLFLMEFIFDKKTVSKENLISKTDLFRIKSRKTNSYLSLKYEEETRESHLVLTSNLSDFTIFKFDFLDFEDKQSFKFFVQLTVLLNYFQVNYTKHNSSRNKIPPEMYHLWEFSKILKSLEERLLKPQQKETKIDMLQNIKEFKVIFKIFMLFIKIWFNVEYDLLDKKISNEKDEAYKRDFQNILEGVETNGILNLKIEITRQITAIFTILFEQDPTVIEPLHDYLHYFFRFVGKIEHVTRFLISILKDNNKLVVSLLSKGKEEKNKIKDSLVEVLFDFSLVNKSSIRSIFELINVFLISNGEPIKLFYNEVLLANKILLEEEEIKPNSDIWCLCDFTKNNRDIHFIPSKEERVEFNLDFSDVGKDEDTAFREELVSLNIVFWSNLTVHDDKVKNKIKGVFENPLVSRYISDCPSFEIKCALLKLANFLYVKTDEVYYNLCRVRGASTPTLTNEMVYNRLSELVGKPVKSYKYLIYLIETTFYIVKYRYSNAYDCVSILLILLSEMVAGAESHEDLVEDIRYSISNQIVRSPFDKVFDYYKHMFEEETEEKNETKEEAVIKILDIVEELLNSLDVEQIDSISEQQDVGETVSRAIKESKIEQFNYCFKEKQLSLTTDKPRMSLEELLLTVMLVSKPTKIKSKVFNIVYKVYSSAYRLTDNVSNLLFLDKHDFYDRYLKEVTALKKLMPVFNNYRIESANSNKVVEDINKVLHSILSLGSHKAYSNNYHDYLPDGFNFLYNFKEVSKEVNWNLLHYQQILNNLGVIEILRGYVTKLVESGAVSASIEGSLMAVYEVLALSIKHSNKFKLLIEEKLESFLCIINSIDKFSPQLHLKVGNFLLEFLRDLKLDEINTSTVAINYFYKLVNTKKMNTELCFFFVEIIKAILTTGYLEKQDYIVFSIKIVKDYLFKNKDHDLIRELVRVINYMKYAQVEDFDNKIKYIFQINEIVDFIVSDCKHSTEFIDIMNLLFEFIFANLEIYKPDLATNKQCTRKIEKLLSYCNQHLVVENRLYREGESDRKVVYVNYFFLAVVPKIHYIIWQIKQIENVKQTLIDTVDNLIKETERFCGMADSTSAHPDAIQQQSYTETVFKYIREEDLDFITGQTHLLKKTKILLEKVKMSYKGESIDRSVRKHLSGWLQTKDNIENLTNNSELNGLVTELVAKERDDLKNVVNDKAVFSCMTKIMGMQLDAGLNNEKVIFYSWLLIASKDKEVMKTNVEMVYKILKNKNINCIDYYSALSIRFYNEYFKQINTLEKKAFFQSIIASKESEYLFNLMKTIIENFNKSLTSDRYSRYIPAKYEKEIDIIEETFIFISNLLESNELFKLDMKDYLRFQHNNSRSNNFINLIASMLCTFMETEDKVANYFNYVKLSIQCLTKACNGPCLDNQNTLVNDTQIVDFIEKFITKPYEDDYLSNGELALLKYNLMLLLIALIEGRKKQDRIFLKIMAVIDDNKISRLMVETLNEVLREKKVSTVEKLVLTSDLYQRFEDKELKDKENFIIIEIGTFAYITKNIFKPEKIIETKEKDKNIVFFTSFMSFFLILWQLIKSPFQLCKAKKKNVTEVSENEEAVKFFSSYTPNIEIMFEGRIIQFYVKLFPQTKYIDKEIIREFQDSVDRTSQKSKLGSLFSEVGYFKALLEYRMKIERFFGKLPIFTLFLNLLPFYEDLSFLLAFALNILIMFSYHKHNDEFIYSFFYDPANNDSTEQTFRILAMVQMIASGCTIVNYIVKRVPRFLYTKDKGCFSIILNIVTDYSFLYRVVYFGFAFLGFTLHYFFFSFHLLDLIRRSKTLKNVVNAIWIPKKQIIVTLFLFVLVTYVFTIFIYLFFYEHLPQEEICQRFDMCMVTIFDKTFKNSNGIINYLDSDKKVEEYYLGSRFVLDNLYAIVLMLLILEMLSGIIIDNFSALRLTQQKEDEDKNNVCFICGLHKNDLNKLYGNENGFVEHTTTDHNYWNYLFLVMNIINKDVESLAGLDLWIRECYLKESFNWIPNGTFVFK